MAGTDKERELTLAADFPKAGYEDWLRQVEAVLNGADFDQTLVSRTRDGIEIAPLYTQADAGAPEPLWFRPGEGAWEVCQLFANPNPAVVNEALRRDVEGGVNAVLLQIEAPGQGGVRLDDGDALAKVLEGVALASVPIRLRAGARFAEAASWLLDLWRATGIEAGTVRGALNADPLGALAAAGALSRPLEEMLAHLARVARTATETCPQVTAAVADGRVYHEGGASEAQELACALATAAAYLRAMEAEGIAPEAAFPRIAVTLAADADQFPAMAKFRAMRRLWAHMAGACGVAPEQAPLFLHGESSARMMTRCDPWVNMLRATVASFAAGLGGADSVTVRPYTTALGLPDAFARRIARNTQIILQEESALARVRDAARGAWFLESLTREMAAAAWDLFRRIEAEGGMAPALQSGLVQGMIAETAEARAADVARRKEKITGVSAFPDLAERVPETVRRPAPPEATGPHAIEPVRPRPLAEPFERLREASDAVLASSGARPSVFLANLGRIADFNARAGFARNLFAAGGIEAIENDGFSDSESAAAAFKASGARIACLCSSDAVYAEMAETAARALKQAGAERLYLAGHPGPRREALEAAGVHSFIHMGCNVLELLEDAHELLGATS